MRILLLTLAVGLAGITTKHLSSRLNGNWRTMSIAADNVEKIEENGVLRVSLRHLKCLEGCKKLSIKFHVNLKGECKEFTVVGVKDEEKGVYVAEYSGQNFFNIIDKINNTIVFSNLNVDEEGKETRVILAAGKRDSLTEEEEQKFAELAQEKGIPKENIRNFVETEICPE